MLVCECGATRASAGLRTMACVKCGRAMHAPLAPAEPRPGIGLVALGVLVGQLACVVVIGLAAVAMISTGEASGATLAVAGGATFGVLAGMFAYRGSTVALLVVAVIVATIAGGLLSEVGALGALPRAQSVVDPDLVGKLIAGVAALAAVLCASAIPQARRYAAWHDEQIERVVRSRS